MADIADHLLKPSRRAFLKAMGAIAGAAMLPPVAAKALPLAPEMVLPPVIPPIPATPWMPPAAASNLTVFRNGIMLMEGMDFVCDTRTGTISLLDPPNPNDSVIINYQSDFRKTNGSSHYSSHA